MDGWLIFAVFHCFQGESGQKNLAGPSTADAAIKNFEKKFKDKTKNNWSDREDFVSHYGKYTLIEVDGDQDAEVKVFSLFLFIYYILDWTLKSLKFAKE